METWTEVLADKIPKNEYQKNNFQTDLIFGEMQGLVIKLTSLDYIITLDFGRVVAINIFDEGIMQQAYFDDENDERAEKLKNNCYPNLIYEVKGGKYMKLVEEMNCGLYAHLIKHHYVIVTMNYVTEIIAEVLPEIKVQKNERT